MKIDFHVIRFHLILKIMPTTGLESLLSKFDRLIIRIQQSGLNRPMFGFRSLIRVDNTLAKGSEKSSLGGGYEYLTVDSRTLSQSQLNQGICGQRRFNLPLDLWVKRWYWVVLITKSGSLSFKVTNKASDVNDSFSNTGVFGNAISVHISHVE